jgi:hypothetical protein
MEEPQNELICSKCGGKMVQGRIKIRMPMSSMGVQIMPQMGTGFEMRGLNRGIEETTTFPKWEERTGQKKGIIFKREEVKEMNIQGYRCILCNYIELYAT